MTDEQADGGAPDAPEFSAPVQEFVNSVLAAAKEADLCLKGGNKAAGRRARKALSGVKKSITPLRDAILGAMKGESKE